MAEGLPGFCLINGVCSFPVQFWAPQKAILEMCISCSADCLLWGAVLGNMVRERGNEQGREETHYGQLRFNSTVRRPT